MVPPPMVALSDSLGIPALAKTTTPVTLKAGFGTTTTLERDQPARGLFTAISNCGLETQPGQTPDIGFVKVTGSYVEYTVSAPSAPLGRIRSAWVWPLCGVQVQVLVNGTAGNGGGRGDQFVDGLFHGHHPTIELTAGTNVIRLASLGQTQYNINQVSLDASGATQPSVPTTTVGDNTTVKTDDLSSIWATGPGDAERHSGRGLRVGQRGLRGVHAQRHHARDLHPHDRGGGCGAGDVRGVGQRHRGGGGVRRGQHQFVVELRSVFAKCDALGRRADPAPSPPPIQHAIQHRVDSTGAADSPDHAAGDGHHPVDDQFQRNRRGRNLRQSIHICHAIRQHPDDHRQWP